MSDYGRMKLTFSVAADIKTRRALRESLAGKSSGQGAVWLCQVLVEKLERLLEMTSDSEHGRLTVLSGRVGGIQKR